MRLLHDLPFPFKWGEFIMGNYIAGGKVNPVPEVLDKPFVNESLDEVFKTQPEVL